ncbi:non-ribosomal peptide synthetase [Pseudomonas chlororaphis]|uniref:non-ribosomal peptide synthetase n=1 Tax=Pseudomonas chlororaphis TaxID=587753 RepID=UPI0007B3673E|nr:non-ribosomal peptide synthetase [Pseudomonas chlororaphis]AZC62590.1 Polyketide synthase [Pseudomonas chlororaphis subsp. piscium]KZO48934.1 amino acid adenylation enzyme/thioester reductase family protein [Pseudomonas chlororaphis subsp. piscium]MBP5066859.1 non-ribosomal peptide synthetase [Pseudomonas chlororaphis]
MNAVATKEQLLAAYKAGEISTAQLKSLLFAAEPTPLSAGQKGLWALHKTLPDITAYQIPLCFRCDRALDLEALQQAYRRVLTSYPLLTSVLHEVQGQPSLRPQAVSRFGLVLEDVRGMPTQQVLDRLHGLSKQPLPLEGTALIDGHVFQADEQWWGLFRVHHIVFDGTSALLFLNHLFDAYQSLVSGLPPHVEQPSAHFAEFVAWQNEMLAGPAAQPLLDYWQGALEQVPPPLELTTDFARSSTVSFEGSSLRQSVPEALNARLERFCSEHGLTRAVFFLGVFNGLLSRYTQQQDIVVGMPTLGRPKECFGQSIGYFMNMVPIRSRDIESGSARDYLRRLQETMIDAVDHSDYPFPTLLKALKVPRNHRQRPLFNIAFAHQNFASSHWLQHLEHQYTTPLGITMVEQLRQEGEYELELEIIESADGALINFKYATALFEPARIERMLAHYLQLVEGVLADPQRSLADHDIVAAQERALLQRCNDTDLKVPAVASLLEWVQQQAERDPEKTAFRYQEHKLGYRALMQGAKALGNFLSARGIGPGAKVAICVERSLDLPLAILGVLHSGAAYVPLDPTYPGERQRYMLEDSGASLLLSQSTITRDWPVPCDVLCMDEQRARIAEYADSQVPQLKVRSDSDLAYLIYTSGSTGKPKGVMVPHSALNNFLHGMAEMLQVDERDRLLAVTTFSFDIAGLELFLGLVRGAECVLCDAAVASDAERLKALIEHSDPSLMQATPTTWQLLFQVGWQPSSRLKVLCGGEAMPVALFQRFQASSAQVWNLYGPTETTIWSSAKRLDHAKGVTIGGPIANTQLHVFNQYRRLQPIGVPGELAIAGAGLATGYHRLAEQTADKFVADPFRPGQRMFLTGDSALRLEDGEIRCLGRQDLQVKVRGHRIDVEEIETCIVAQCPVRSAVVVLHQASEHASMLVAYLQADSAAIDQQQLIATVKAELGKHLPGYMMPQRFVCEQAMPMTANGKVDRKALMARMLPKAADKVVATAPPVSQPQTVEQVRQAWQQVLGYPVEDDETGFFDFGGDSVSAVQVAQLLSERLQRKVAVTLLFQYPTVSLLGAALNQLAPVLSDDGAPSTADASLTQAPERLPDALEGAAAVIGMSCQFAQSVDLEAFWDNLCQGRACVTRWSDAQLRELNVPESMIRNPQFVPVKAILDDKHAFDATFFGLSPRDAGFMSPAFKHLLMHAWRAFEDAGYIPEQTPSTAVYISAGQSMSGQQGAADAAYFIEDADEYVRWLMGQGGSIPTMISYKLGLSGPSVFLQTNCSSSLVALQAGLDSIRSGAADYALVGAATVFPVSMAGYLHQPGLNFSSSGQCRAFDAEADGMVSGEGVAMLLLKRASLALADGDPAYALLKEVQVNNDGALKAGFFAPSVAGQAAVIGRVLDKAGVEPQEVGYIETHGTGTALGDPVEFAALSDAYASSAGALRFCGLGSVKSNIGHTDTAAGLAGSIKAILSLVHQKIPPTLHIDSPNRQIDLEHSSFFLVDRLRPWPAQPGRPRHAAVSSFGVGGTNAHALFRSADDLPARPASVGSGPYLVLLSAKTEDKCRVAAQQLLAFVQNSAPSLDLGDLAYTLQVGRKAWPQRIAMVVSDRNELCRTLANCIEGRADDALHRGRASRQLAAREGLASAASDVHSLARHWVQGGHLEGYQAPTGDRPPRRIHLPTYPFITDRERHSMPTTLQNTVEPVPQPVPAPPAGTASHALQGAVCWVREPSPAGESQQGGRTAIVCDALDLTGALGEMLHIDPRVFSDQAALATLFEQHAHLEHLIWLLPEDRIGTLAGMQAEQHRGVLWGATLLQALGGSYHGKALKFTVVTRRSVAIFDQDPLVATHSGAHGLVGTVVKEHPHWQARIVDVEDLGVVWTTAFAALPFERSGRPWAYRAGDWFRPSLHLLDDSLGSPDRLAGSTYRQGGVYVIVGGAGAIGQDWSAYLLRNYQAQLVWIGRSAADAQVQASIERLAALGPAPLYVQADATDLEQLQRACDAIRQRFPRIHGVVHSAMVRENQVLQQQTAQDFERQVNTKVAIALNLAQLFSEEPLDFLLFFSSINAFYLAPNSCAYAAGGSFIGALADQLNQRRDRCAKVVYWPHWETAQLREDSQGVRQHLARLGFGVLPVEQGMAQLETFLAQPFTHMASLRLTSETKLQQLNFSGFGVYAKQQACAADMVPATTLELDQAQRLIEITYGRLDEIAPLLRALMWRQIDLFLGEAGLTSGNRRGRYSLKHLQSALSDGHYLLRWLNASLRILEDREEITLSGDQIILSSALEDRVDSSWERWQTVKAELEKDPFLASVSRFIDVALQATPDVLGSRKKATDVFFSNSSMALVESIYKENPVVHYYGSVVGKLVAAQIEAIVARQPDARIRLLEVGAGTGSCTEHVLAALKPFAENISEYCFTDLSQLFLQRAERRYRSEHPYLATRIFNAEKEPQAQGMTPEHYDVVIAANVIHATQDIRTSVRHIQSLMKTHGQFLLLELTENSLFSHLTFGLLEGWWRFTDPELRMPYGPALSAASWRSVLLDQAFDRVSFPCAALKRSDLQVVVGRSSGFGLGPQAPRRWTSVQAPEATAPTQPHAPAASPGAALARTVACQAAPAQVAVSSAFAQVRSTLAQVFSQALGVPTSDIDGDESLGDYGLDSIIGVKLVQQINAQLNVELVAGVLFEFNTLNLLASHVAGLLPESRVTPAPAVEPVCAAVAPPVLQQRAQVLTPSHKPRPHDVAIVGMSAQFPGANSLSAFWNNIEEGIDCTQEIPEERWDWRQFFGKSDGANPRTESRWGGFIDNVYHFDPLFFELSPYEAALMDPQQRLLLKHAWLAIEDAGVALKRFAAKKTGVFMAVGASEYAYTVQLPVGNPLVASSISSAMVANRISHLFNLRGPSEHYDTGCSSSLVALHRALVAMANGECEQALVGGVQLVLSPLGAINLGAVGFLSSDGQSRSFQAGADGFVRSEGVGVLVLKSLEQAIADRDDIYAVLKGSGVAHGGKGVSLTSPNAQGMKEAIVQALDRAGVEPGSLSYVETHGIASEIGDSIEIQALKSTLDDGAAPGDCVLSSLKPVIGHAEIASGIGALIKTALALRNRLRPGVPGFSQASEHLSLAHSRLSIAAQPRDWPAPASGHPRRAGVNSFGFGGVNAFAVLEEYVHEPSAWPSQAGERQLLVLSAKQDPALRRSAAALLDFLENNAALDLAQLAAALWRKTALPVRLAMVVSDLQEAVTHLRAFVASEPGQAGPLPGCHYGDESNRSPALHELLESPSGAALLQGVREQRDYPRLASLWCCGVALDIDPALSEQPGLRLPAYVFDERICKLPAHTDGFSMPNLSAPGRAATPREAERVRHDGDAPQDAEAQLRLMLASLLQLEPDELDFQRPVAQYGVDSLTAVMLQNRIFEHYGIRPGLPQLLNCRNFAELARSLPQVLATVAVQPREAALAEHPPSVGQQGLWTEQRYFAQQAGYNIPYAFRLDGRVDARRLFAAAEETVARHSLLGANFELRGESLWVRNNAHPRPQCTVHEYQGADDEALQASMRAIARKPFKLESDALLRVDLFVQAPDQDSTVLMLTFHHSVFDGSSLPIFLGTFLALYEQGPEADVPAPRSNYSAFVEWQQRWLLSEEGVRAGRFWHSRLSTPHMPLALRGQQPGEGRDRQPEMLKVALPARTLEGLARMAEQHNVSSYSLMLAAFGLLLRRLGATRQLRVATPFFGRPHTQFEDLVGYFVNLLVMPLDVPEESALGDWLPTLQQELLEALEHGHYPYPRLHQELARPGQPLYDAVFMYQNWVRSTQRRLASSGRHLQPMLQIQQQVDFPLAFEVFEGEEGSTLFCHFDAAIYPPAMMQELQLQYLDLLATLPALAAAQGIPQAVAPAAQPSLAALFERQAALTPQQVALICDDQQLDYQRLNQHANQLARQIRQALPAHGEQEVVIGLLLEPGPAFVAAALAVWKLGLAYLALDPALPASRLAYMVADSGCLLVVSHGAARQRLQGTLEWAVPELDLDALQAQIDAQDVSDGVSSRFQDFCYVIYTSGSSGRPKGVKGSQRGTLNRLQWGWNTFPYGEQERCCQKTSLNFVDHVAELFAPLLQGVPSVVLPDHWLRERGAAAFLQALEGHRITRMVVIPSLLRAMLQEPSAATALGSLRYCFSSGEPLSADLAKTFFALCPQSELINIYGSSEMSADATFKRVTPGAEEQINIGRELDNVSVVIVDEQDRRCAMGVTGQLLVAGDALALGYIGQDDEHERRFALLDLDATGPRRYFRSGDLGYRLANGEMVLSGRHDQQVKVKGQRIELGEIEAALREHAGVLEALVKQAGEDSGLEAFLTLSEALDGRTLREHLGRTLPRYMIPNRFYQLAQLPRLASGKVDRLSLSAAGARLLPHDAQHEPGGPDSAIGSDNATRLLQAIAQVLQVAASELSLDQDFYQLGFDSFRFVRLADALNAAFGVNSSPADFYRHGTPRKWLASLALPSGDEAREPVPTSAALDEPIAVVGMAGVFPGADDLGRFWQQLYEGNDLVSETPAARWRWQDYADQPGGAALRWGGFINDVDKFSPGFFGLSPLEAEFMDPQHRLFLESAWHALEDAGYAPRTLPEREVGVFVGVSSMDYAGKLMINGEVDPLANFGNGHSMLANRVSYLLDLTGPSVAIDTACSSSLVAIHEGVKAIRNGDCRWALVGGVNILLEPRITLAMGKAKMLSPEGRCKTFAADADGYVRGEGAGVLVLKTLKQALADNDQIHGVIRGSAVNHGGRANSMTAPNPQAQADLVHQLYQRVGISPDQVSYIETHGTGTPIGDPIEINALKEAWQRGGYQPASGARCALGALKSNIGHLEAAAGIAGAIKLLLCLKHKTLVKNLHCARTNPYIDLQDSPFYLLEDSGPWLTDSTRPRMAGLSSFGIGGTNAHLLFEEFSKESADE